MHRDTPMWPVDDNQIDEVARELTAAPAPGDLRARVMERLRPGRSRRIGWVLSPVAVAAAIVVAVALRGGWHARPSPPRQTVTQAATQPAAPAPTSPGLPRVQQEAAVDAPRATAVATAGATRTPVRRLPALDSRESAVNITELAVSALAVDHVQLTAMPAPDTLAPRALALAPLALAPLGPDDRQRD